MKSIGTRPLLLKTFLSDGAHCFLALTFEQGLRLLRCEVHYTVYYFDALNSVHFLQSISSFFSNQMHIIC